MQVSSLLSRLFLAILFTFQSFSRQGVGRGNSAATLPDMQSPLYTLQTVLHMTRGPVWPSWGSLSSHCFLLSCSVPQPLSCTLSPSSISWTLATMSGLLTQTHSHFLPCLENAPSHPNLSPLASPAPCKKTVILFLGTKCSQKPRGDQSGQREALRSGAKQKGSRRLGRKLSLAAVCRVGMTEPATQALDAISHHKSWLPTMASGCLRPHGSVCPELA